MKRIRLRNRYRNYLSLEALVIILVMASFHFIPDKKWASVLTSLLFIGTTSGILYIEAQLPDRKKRPSFWGALIFLFLSALPIFIIRLYFWDMPFDQIDVLGISGPLMHKTSNHIFIIMMVCFFADSYMETMRSRKASEEADR